MTCIELRAIGQKLSTTLKSKDLAILHWLSNKIQDTPTKTSKVETSFRKVSLLPAELLMLFPVHLWVREFVDAMFPTLRWKHGIDKIA